MLRSVDVHYTLAVMRSAVKSILDLGGILSSMNDPRSASRLSPNVLIVGAGWIGQQIALRMAVFGVRVQLYDSQPDACQQAMGWMLANEQVYMAARAALTNQLGIASDRESEVEWRQNVSIVPALDLVECSPDIVLECVTEQVSVKKRVLRELSTRFPSPTIIASNSSYFTPSMLCKYVTDDARFAHFHFHAPLFRSTVADVVGGPNTAASVIGYLTDVAKMMGQQVMLLRREHPGYVVNWLLQSLLRSSLELAEKGVAEPKDIDVAWKLVSGMQAGPFQLMDEIGLELIHQGLSNARWAQTQANANEQLLEFLNGLLSAGKLGRKSGCGFYQYDDQGNICSTNQQNSMSRLPPDTH